jgi:hypothetical protein
MEKEKFVERRFEEVEGGYYDEYGFYYTQNGSNIIAYKGFWDADGIYFNRDGVDKHGGRYDDNWKYIPGRDWDVKNQCYKDEIGSDLFDEDLGGKC